MSNSVSGFDIYAHAIIPRKSRRKIKIAQHLIVQQVSEDVRHNRTPTTMAASSTNAIVKKAYADTAYGQIHYQYALPLESQATPKRATPLIFLHKSASSSASYVSLMKIYSSRGYKCYAPDMPGFGNSFDPSPSDILSIQEQGTKWYCELFMSVFRQLGIFDKPDGGEPIKVHILGHHSGACLALELAVLFPELILSICLLGPAVMSAAERAAMKEVYFAPFNSPTPSGSHLTKTWDYLASMGVGEDIELWQREAIDHIRAWRGRNLIYGAVWEQDGETLYRECKPRVLLMCAKDDVLWKYFGHVKSMRNDVQSVVVGGGNFELDRDVDGVEKGWSAFIED